MTKQRKNTVYFTSKQTDYLTQWWMKPDEVLATELASLFDDKFSAEEIATKRAEMKLPPPDPEKSVAATILGRSHQNTSFTKPDERPLSAAQMMRGSKSNPKPPEVRKNFQTVSPVVHDKIEQLNNDRRENSDFNFTPVFVTKPVKGNIYVYPGMGPVVCGDTTSMNVAGFDMQTITFSTVYASTSKAVVGFDPAKIAQKFIRELATPEMMENVLHKLAHGKGVLTDIPKTGVKYKPYFEAIIASSNPAELANLLCYAFKSDKASGARANTEIIFANLALDLMAAEYAVVKDVPLDHAKDLLERVVGKPTVEDLSRRYPGRGAVKAAPTTP